MAPLQTSERAGDRRCATEATATAAATATSIIAAALDSVVKSAAHVPMTGSDAAKGSNGRVARCASRKVSPDAVVAAQDISHGHRRGDGASALCVLTNQALLEQIADFMCGVPNLLVEFKRSALASSASYRYEENDPWSRTVYCSRDDDGFLTRLAMECDDRRVLRMLLRIHEMPFYRYMTALRFDMVLAVGAKLGQLKTLQWLAPKLKHAANSTTTATLQAQRLLDIAIAKGNLAMMQWLQDAFPDACRTSISPFVIESAPREVRFQVAHWLHTHEYSDRCLFSARVVNYVAEQGDLVTLRFLHNALDPDAVGVFTSTTMDIAASCGHLEVVRFLHQRRDEGCTTRAMDLAAQHGDFEIVRFLHQYRREGCTTAAMDDAAAYGHTDITKFFHTYRNEGCTHKAMDLAARNGHIDIVQFLHDHRREGCTQDAMDQAGSRGHLQVLQFLHAHRLEGCTTAAMDGAASAGHLDIVRFLHENRLEGCTTDAMDRSAQNGHLDVVHFLHEKRTEGCTRAAMNSAASHGHLEIVEFLHAHRSEGCSKRALSSAARHGFTKVVRFLVENRVEGCAEEALRAAYRNGRFEVARYLHDRGFMGNVSKCVISCCCPTILHYS